MKWWRNQIFSCPTKRFVKNSQLSTSCWAHHFLFHSLRPNKGITFLVPRVETSAGARRFCFRTPSLWNSLLRCVCSAVQLQPPRNISRHISLTLPFPYRHQHASWPCLCYKTAAMILQLSTNLAVVPMSLASLGILMLYKYD